MYGEEFMNKTTANFNRTLKFGALGEMSTEQLQAALQADSEAQAVRFQQLMEEGRLRLIERFRNMKIEHPDSPAVQDLCNKEIARLEAEGTGT